MARTLHVIGIDAKGKASVLLGPDLSVKEVREQFAEFSKIGKFPKGIVSAELFDSHEGRIRTVVDEGKRRIAATEGVIRSLDDSTTATKEALGRAEARLKELEGKSIPERHHTEAAIKGFKHQLEDLARRKEDAQKELVEHRKADK